MKKYFVFALIFAALVSCNQGGDSESKNVEEKSVEQDENSLSAIKENIKLMDDSIEKLYAAGGQLNRSAIMSTIKAHLKMYQFFPENEQTSASLYKSSLLYEQLRLEKEAMRWNDTIINSYPDFVDYNMVVENQISYFDNFDTYEPEQIKKYSNMLLADSTNLSKEKVEGLKYRLDNIDLSFTELAAKRAADSE